MYDKHCVTCHLPFQANHHSRQFCSDSCSPYKKICLICQSPFQPRNRATKYCSRRCFGATERIQPNLEPSQSLAYLVGVRYGDGNITKSGMFRVRVTDKAFAESCASAARQIGLRAKVSGPAPPPKRFGGRKPVYSMLACARTFTNWLLHLTISDLSLVFTDPPHRKEFIRGIFESEGCIGRMGKTGLQMNITSINKELLQLVQQWMVERGHTARLRLQKITSAGKLAFELRISSKLSIIRFLQDIEPVIKTPPGELLTTRFIFLTHDGLTLTASEWSKKTGIPHSVIHGRLYAGWSAARILTTPYA